MQNLFKCIHLIKGKKYNPDQKFPFPLTSSMDIGWKTYDSENKLTSRTHSDRTLTEEEFLYTKSLNQFPTQNHALKNIMISEFKRNNGCLSDNYKDDLIKARKQT